MNEKLGSKIKSLREGLGLSQQKLGERLKVSQSRIRDFERTGNVPDKSFVALAEALEIVPEELDRATAGRLGYEENSHRAVLREWLKEEGIYYPEWVLSQIKSCEFPPRFAPSKARYTILADAFVEASKAEGDGAGATP